jgi:hypothetical protein
MLILLDGVGPEHRVFLRRLGGIELPHDRLVDPVCALKHSARMVRIVAAAQIRMAVRSARRLAAGLQDAHLVEITGDLDRRFGALRRRGGALLPTLPRAPLPALSRAPLGEQRHEQEADNRHGDSSCPSHLGAPSEIQLVRGHPAFRNLSDDAQDAVRQLDVFRRASFVTANLRGAGACVMSFPMFAVKSCLVVPFRLSAFGVIISSRHATVLPAASVTSI